MIQNFDWKADHRIWLGCSGTGKTTHFLRTLKSERAKLKFVFDHQGEISRKLGCAPCFTIEQVCQACERGGYVIFDPVRVYPGRNADAFLMFADFAFTIGANIRGRKIFACDELGKLTENNVEPEEFVALLETGRRYQMDTFCIAQSANALHNRIRNQWTSMVAFRQQDDNAIKPLKNLGLDETQLRNLKNGEYLTRNCHTGENSRGGKAF